MNSRSTTTATTPVLFGCPRMGKRFRTAAASRFTERGSRTAEGRPRRLICTALSDFPTPTSSIQPRRGSFRCNATCGGTIWSIPATWCNIRSSRSCGKDKDHLSLSAADASAQTPPMTITGQASAHVSAYFNKGIVSAQWVSRALATIGKNAKLDSLIGQPDNTLRNALSGLLRPQLLQSARRRQEERRRDLCGALRAERSGIDPEARGARAEMPSHPRQRRLQFARSPTKTALCGRSCAARSILHDRLVGQGHFAHNKFVVACDAAGKPQRVLSGSTNWTKTGLCTQANNGILVDDPNLGAFFIDQWNLLKARGKRLSCIAHAGELEVRTPSTSMAARSRNGSRRPTRARISTMRASLSTARRKAFCSCSSIRACSSRTTSRSNGRSCRTFWPGISRERRTTMAASTSTASSTRRSPASPRRARKSRARARLSIQQTRAR